MEVLRGIRNSVAFLTIIPVGMDNDGFAIVARFMPVFPLVGALAGLIGGMFTWSLESIFTPQLSGTLGLGLILLLNGAQHVDGLLDFGDGIMCHGSRSRKLRVMRDPQTGAGGFTLGMIVVIATIFAIASLNRNVIINAMVVSESASKFSMVVQAWMGRSAHRGMSSQFIESMQLKHRNAKIALSTAFLLLISVPLLSFTGLLVTFAALGVSSVMSVISKRAFGGITGDVMGATNEITRLVSLILIPVGLAWL
ncbi:MAG TPA: adenosylcobinamide-GDP ribazoletransferase [Candidatus Bathyarchaeia archaeon]|nr:adenosylcobinamide-GDP ribazoletransferase [Candidatus Bathyarchaeia archaeon]